MKAGDPWNKKGISASEDHSLLRDSSGPAAAAGTLSLQQTDVPLHQNMALLYLLLCICMEMSTEGRATQTQCTHCPAWTQTRLSVPYQLCGFLCRYLLLWIWRMLLWDRWFRIAKQHRQQLLKKFYNACISWRKCLHLFFPYSPKCTISNCHFLVLSHSLLLTKWSILTPSERKQ